MSAPSKAYNIQLVKIQPGERLAITPELNPARSVVTLCCEARGMGYWAATQVKVLSPEIHHVSEADVFHLTEGSTHTAVSPTLTRLKKSVSLTGTRQGIRKHSFRLPDEPKARQGDECPAGSESVARYQMDIVGTWEAQGVLPSEVCAVKPMNGKTVQTTLWESDQFIVPMKRGNACGGKGLAGIRNVSGTHSLHSEAGTEWQQNWNIQPDVERGSIPEEPDEGKPHVRFREGVHGKPCGGGP